MAWLHNAVWYRRAHIPNQPVTEMPDRRLFTDE